MKIPCLSLRTTVLFVLVLSVHIASLISLNFYTPRSESKIADTDQLQIQITNNVVFEPNLNSIKTPILPLVKKDSKTAKEVSQAEFPPESLENSSVIGASPQNSTWPVEADDLVLKTENENASSSTITKAEEGFKNFFAENDGKKYPVYVYYGGYDMNSKPVGRGFLSYEFDSTDSKYKIQLFAEAMGWAQIFLRKPMFFVSKGHVSGVILKPTYYETHTPKRGKSHVKVVQKSSLIKFHGKTEGISFSGNIYDPLSLIFQIASYSRNGQMFNKKNSETFQVFNRKKLEEIQLSPLPPEEMVLPNGDFITAVKIISRVQRGGKKGDISFWLDTSYDNHPVRITFENKTKNYSLDFLIETGKASENLIRRPPEEKQKNTNKFSNPYLKY